MSQENEAIRDRIHDVKAKVILTRLITIPVFKIDALHQLSCDRTISYRTLIKSHEILMFVSKNTPNNAVMPQSLIVLSTITATSTTYK